jgi:hypothetical protein
MTREEYLNEIGLTILKDGTIASLGKFEGEMLYAPYFSDSASDGGEVLASMEDGGEFVALVAVEQEDRKLFPELDAETAFVGVIENDQGFVSVTELTEKRADQWRAEYAPKDDSIEVKP